MSADLERVARALCRQAIGYCEHWDLDKRVDDEWRCWIPQAYAAMRETLLIAAEALRSPAIGFVDHLDVADWLTARAQETTNGIT
jgi:hypothetical protein